MRGFSAAGSATFAIAVILPLAAIALVIALLGDGLASPARDQGTRDPSITAPPGTGPTSPRPSDDDMYSPWELVSV